MMKALLRLAAVRDTKQAGELRGDTAHFIASSSALHHFESQVNSSGSQKAADSNVALRMNISAPVRSSDSAKISKNVASLAD